MEMMIVVVIAGILAVTAIPTFTSYIMRARTAEATQILGSIGLRQEAYRAEFGAYLPCALRPSQITFVPGNATVMRNAVPRAFNDTSNAAGLACFDTLGVRPSGFVRFGYGFAANAPSAGILGTAEGTPYGLTTADEDHWYVAQAVTDLDGDGRAVTFEATSFTSGIWVGPDGATHAQGWE
jgi:type II secretory pathway pseudopilin PulG